MQKKQTIRMFSASLTALWLGSPAAAASGGAEGPSLEAVFNEDLHTCMLRYLDGASLAAVSGTSRYFHTLTTRPLLQRIIEAERRPAVLSQHMATFMGLHLSFWLAAEDTGLSYEDRAFWLDKIISMKNFHNQALQLLVEEHQNPGGNLRENFQGALSKSLEALSPLKTEIQQRNYAGYTKAFRLAYEASLPVFKKMQSDNLERMIRAFENPPVNRDNFTDAPDSGPWAAYIREILGRFEASRIAAQTYTGR